MQKPPGPGPPRAAPGIPPSRLCSQPSSRHLAYGLQLLTLLIVGGQQEASVAAGPLPPAQVGADDHEVQGVTHTVEIVLLQLGGGEAGEGPPVRASLTEANRGAEQGLG